MDVSASLHDLTVDDSSHQTAERQAGHGGTGPAMAPGQDAGDHTADKDAQFLHTLFCCPITKVRMQVNCQLAEHLQQAADLKTAQLEIGISDICRVSVH